MIKIYGVFLGGIFFVINYCLIDREKEKILEYLNIFFYMFSFFFFFIVENCLFKIKIGIYF